jgi:hypothetical protein
MVWRVERRHGVDSERDRSVEEGFSEREWSRRRCIGAIMAVVSERKLSLDGTDSQMDSEAERRSLEGETQCKIFSFFVCHFSLPAIPSPRTSTFLAAQEWGAL